MAEEHDAILGAEGIDKIINIDQTPIGNSPRSNPATYRGTSIADVLAMTAQQACEHFALQPRIRCQLQMLVDVGLGYMQLGQGTVCRQIAFPEAMAPGLTRSTPSMERVMGI